MPFTVTGVKACELVKERAHVVKCPNHGPQASLRHQMLPSLAINEGSRARRDCFIHTPQAPLQAPNVAKPCNR